MTTLNNVKIINLDNTQIKHVDKSEFKLSKKIDNIITPQPKKDTILTEAALPLSYDINVDIGYSKDVILSNSIIESGTLIKAGSKIYPPNILIENIINETITAEKTIQYLYVIDNSTIMADSIIKAGSVINSVKYSVDTRTSTINNAEGYLLSGTTLTSGSTLNYDKYPSFYDYETETFKSDFITTSQFTTIDGYAYDFKVDTDLAENSQIIGTINGTNYTSSNLFIVGSNGYILSKNQSLPNGNKLVTVQAFNKYNYLFNTFDDMLINNCYYTDNIEESFVETDDDKIPLHIILTKIINGNNIDIYINDEFSFTIENKASDIDNLHICVKNVNTSNMKVYEVVESYNEFKLKLVECISTISYDFGGTSTDINIETDYVRFIEESYNKIKSSKMENNGFLAKYLKLGNMYYTIDYIGQYVNASGNVVNINDYKIQSVVFISGTKKLVIGNEIKFVENGVNIRGITNTNVSSVYFDRKVYNLVYDNIEECFKLTYKS